jgi:hypothetical protein
MGLSVPFGIQQNGLGPIPCVFKDQKLKIKEFFQAYAHIQKSLPSIQIKLSIFGIFDIGEDE